MMFCRLALCALLLISGGCGAEPARPSGDDAPTEVSAASPLPSPLEPAPAELDARVYADQATLPTAAAYEHIGVATTPSELQQQWQRFGFADVPPVIDLEERALLFIGFGESGSCPVVFGGIQVEETTVRLLDNQPQQECTADYNPRTIAVSVASDVLPEGYLTVDMPAGAEDVTISISGVAQPPPATPDQVSASISVVSLAPQPERAPIGSAVDVVIRNDTEDDRVATGQVLTIDRWTGHHFETLGQVTGGDGVVEVGPQESGQLLQLDTGDPEFPTGESGWFRLTARLDVTTGDLGRLDARGNLQLTEQTAAPAAVAAITAVPPCDDQALCSAGVFIGDVRYELSCGLVDPAAVSDAVYATGEGITTHLLEGVDPRVMVAWETSCESPLAGRWHVMFAEDRLGTAEHQAAWCRVSLNGADPAEGFSC